MILVTGGTGFIGPRVVHALRGRDLPVRCLVRRPDRAATLASWGCELVEGDMTDAESLRRACEGADVVVHLVAIIKGAPDDFERIMMRGTRDLVAAAEAAGARRIVLMSALGTSEETRELVPYYRAKWTMEETVLRSPLEHVIFRPSFVFGRDGGVLPTFIRQVRWSPVTTVIGPGDQRLQPIWVEDVAAHFAAAVDHPGAAGETFDLGGPDAVTWNELYERIRRTLGKRRATVHVPFGMMRAVAALTERLAGAPITRDQLTMLAHGDNVGDIEPARAVFGVRLTGLDEQLRRAV
ncbi:MAG: SDR family oxidoreductase [Gaiellaceae bacterium]